MKLRIYLDTSVLSAYYDDRLIDRKIETEQFWNRLNLFEVSTSEITRKELSLTSKPELRSQLLKLLEQTAVVSITPEMNALAQNYVDAGIFTPMMQNDALHVAAAVITRQDVLLSWNFKHLVNRRRRALVNQLNISQNLPTIEILAPPEV